MAADRIKSSGITRWSILFFPLAGLASAVVTVQSQPRIFGHEDFLGGLLFGSCTAFCCWVFMGVRSVWKMLLFIGISGAAAYVSFFFGIMTQDFFSRVVQIGGQGEAEFFVAGCAGAFVLLAAMQLLFLPDCRAGRAFLASGLWSISGGLLGSVSLTAAPAFDNIRRRLAPHQTDADVSLILVWQTGMALIFAVVLLLRNKKQSRAVETS